MGFINKFFLLGCFCLIGMNSYGYEYSQENIDEYIGRCRIGDLFSQARCECAIKKIQEAIPEENYNAAKKPNYTMSEDELSIYSRAMIDCADADEV